MTFSGARACGRGLRARRLDRRRDRRAAGKRPALRAALLASAAVCLTALPAVAQDATWLASPGSTNFNTDANWNPATTPGSVTGTGTAFFGTSSTTSLSFSGNATLDGFTFNSGASSYIFNLNGNTLTFGGDGVTVNGGSATINNAAGGTLNFTNSSSAGSATINNSSGTLTFSDSSTGGDATIVNSGSALLQFLGNSTGGNAAISNSSSVAVDFSGSSGPFGGGSLSAGSIAGTGDFNLGANTLTVGSNNTSTSVSGIISGVGGSLVKEGTGTLTLSGNNTFDGGVALNAGGLTLGHDNAAGSGLLTASAGVIGYGNGVNIANTVVIQGDTVQFNVGSGATATQSGSILEDASGRPLEKTGAGTLIVNSVNNSGTTTITGGTWMAGGGNAFSANSAHTIGASGTLDLGGFNQTIGSLSGSGTVTNNGSSNATLSIGNFGTVSTNTIFSGTLKDGSKTLGLTIDGTGSGPFILTGTNTYTGDTLICDCSSLQIGNGGTSGSIVSNITNNNLLIFNRSDTYTYSGVISDGLGSPGRVEQNGTGTTILTNTNTYSGTTTINSGTLQVDGSLLNSTTTVNDGGTLGGNGTLGDVVINNGGKLSPGASIGTITVNDLTFNSNSIYKVELSPGGTSDLTNVNGTASLAGKVQAVGTGGTYTLGTQYTILHSNSLSYTGTFSGVTYSGFGALRPELSYVGLDVLLTMVQGLVTPQLTGATINQTHVAGGIDNAINGGATPNTQFSTLIGLSGDDLNNALTQVSGETPNGGTLGVLQMTNSFLTLMLNPFAGAPGGNPGGLGFARSFGAADGLSPEAAAAYAAVTPRDARADPYAASGWRSWAATYGGYNKSGGDGVVGSSDTIVRNWGVAAGADYRVAPDAMLGFAVTGGGLNWGLAQGQGSGRSDAFQIGGYGSRSYGPAFVSAALTYGWHAMTTDRTVTVGGAEELRASFGAQTVGARLESGYRMVAAPWLAPWTTVTPYAALQAQNVRTPGYSETAVSGAGAFALSYDKRSVTGLRTELGTWLDQTMPLDRGNALALRARLAWAHDHAGGQDIGAVFQTLPGSGFVINGAAPPTNLALLSAGAEYRLASNVSFGAKLDGEFAPRAQTYSGTGTVRYTW